MEPSIESAEVGQVIQNEANSGQRSTERVTEILLGEIQRGRWTGGHRLPSSRWLAQDLQVSPSAVHRALQKLAEEGFVRPRPRSGWYLAESKVINKLSRRKPRTMQGREVVFSLLNPVMHRFMDLPESWSNTIMAEVSEVLDQQGLRITLQLDEGHPTAGGLPSKCVQEITNMNEPPAGVLMFSQAHLQTFQNWLSGQKIPWVCIGRPEPQATQNFVSPDFTQLGRLAGVAFGAEGYERILYLGAPLNLLPSERERLNGFCTGYIEAAGRLPSGFSYTTVPNSPQEYGYTATLRHLESHPVPQAIVAAGDYLALGAIRALREKNLRCPEDVVVLGTTGLEIGELTEPRLTTVKQPMAEVGRQAAQLLVEMLQTNICRLPGMIFPVAFDFRDSFPLTEKIDAALRQIFGNEYSGQRNSSGAEPEAPASQPAPEPASFA